MPTGKKRERAKRNLLILRALKQQNPCTDCKRFYPHYVMEFDHREPGSRLANATQWTTGKMLQELEKVDLVCSNCHAIRTYQRRKYRQSLLGEE